jgi:hypothetical protein
MKSILKDVLFGVLIVIVITLLEFVVTIPFGLPADGISRDEWATFISRELLITAVPAFLTTFVFALLLKTKNKADAIQKAVFWTSILCVNYFIMGLGNDNLGLIFGTIGIYVLLICAFAGPLVYAKVKHLK